MGFFDKIKQGLKKTSDAVNHSLDSVVAAFVKVDDDLLEELEEALILSDVGASTAAKNWSDDDPWAKPAVSNASPQSADGFAPNEPVATPAPEEHHKKHVAVPDISDGVDPWAAPAAPVAPTASVASAGPTGQSTGQPAAASSAHPL